MNQVRPWGVLQNVPGGAGVQTSRDHFLLFIHREDQHLDFLVGLLDAARGLESAQVGHRNIHQHNIRVQLVSLADGLSPVMGLAYYLDGAFVLEDRLDALAEQGVIVTDQNL